MSFFDEDFLAHYRERSKSWARSRQNKIPDASCGAQETLQENPTCEAGEEPDALESKLQGKIEAELKRRGWLFFHDRSRKCNEPGLPDLLIWAPGGRHILMECKKKGGKGERAGSMSDDQKRFAARALWLGHEFHEVRSYKQAVGILDNSQKGKTQ